MSILEKAGFYLAVFLIAGLLVYIFFSRNGVMDYQKLKEREAVVTEQIQAARKKNLVIEKKIRSLKDDLNYIKHLAKQKHDMAEKNELIFKTKSKNKGETP